MTECDVASDSEKKFRICSSTQNTFDGWSVRKVWEKESLRWLHFTQGNSSSSYHFPTLEQSPYLDDNSKNLRQPVICQDISWAADGTSFVTIHNDYGIRQYLIPEEESEDNLLIPFTRTFKNQSIVASKVHPKYSLYNSFNNQNMILLGLRDLPLQLLPLNSDGTHPRPSQSYQVIDSTNEKFQVPYILDFNDDDSFLAGFKRNKVSLYNIQRSLPVASVHSTKGSCGASLQKTIVSCFDEQAPQSNCQEKSRIFGTYKNELYLLDLRTFSSQFLYRSLSGTGFTQILKSSNGHYLYVLKRRSDAIDVLDTRLSYRKVNELKLPDKLSNQKIKAIITASGGLCVGTNRGSVVEWTGGLIEFGGISRDSMTGQGVGNERETAVPIIKNKVNIIQQCPTDHELYAISYSPDKHEEHPTGTEQSGLLTFRNSTE